MTYRVVGLDLSGLELEPLEIGDAASGGLEFLAGGQGMTEMAGSILSAPCCCSCCLCCCCCG